MNIFGCFFMQTRDRGFNLAENCMHVHWSFPSLSCMLVISDLSLLVKKKNSDYSYNILS